MGKVGAMLTFLAGAAIGGAAAWYVAKERYSAQSEEDIASAKEAFHAREKKLQEEIDILKGQQTEEPEQEETASVVATPGKTADKGDITDYARMVQNSKNYTQYSQTVVPKPAQYTMEAPYVISPMDFGELDGYTQISLLYFDDGILADDNGIIIDEPEEIVGDALEHFGEYEDDSVYVRSDARRSDYEILKDMRSYAEFRTTLPPTI